MWLLANLKHNKRPKTVASQEARKQGEGKTPGERFTLLNGLSRKLK